jgi:hypothetical protein
MKLWHSFLLGVSLSLLCASPAFAIDSQQVMDGIRDHGVDWLKDKAKDAGKEWVFGTGQSETMQSIIDAAKDATTEGLYGDSPCRGLVRSQASTVLSDIQLKNTAKNVGRTAFDTLTKVGSLAAGGLGAAAEGGGLAWLGKQYADGVSDSVKEAIKKVFDKDEKPEFEMYEQSGTVGSGPCTYTLRAVWDIVGGTYYVYIFGDCQCKTAQSVSGSRALGKWWVTVYGSMRLVVDKTAKTAKFVPITPATVDWDGECDCSKRELRRPVFKKVVKTGTSTTGTTGGGTTEGGTGVTPGGGTTTPPPPPPIPPKGRQVCKECQGIQDRIDADTDALADADRENHDAILRVQRAQAALASQQGILQQKKASPGSIDISEEQIGEKIGAAKADVASAQAEADKAAAEMDRLKNELRDLGVELDKCIAKCGHASSHHKHSNALINFGIEKALDSRHTKDNQDDEEERRRREEEQNASHNDQDPYH